MGISALLAAQILDASATGRSVLTGADAAAIRTTLGLGTLATQSPTGTPSASTFLRGDFSWQTIDLSGYVPYSGATGAVNLGSNSLTAGAGAFTTLSATNNITTSAAPSGQTYGLLLGNGIAGAASAYRYISFSTTWGNVDFLHWGGRLGFYGVGTSNVVSPSFGVNSDGSFEFSPGNAFSSAGDVVLRRDTSDTLGLRRSTNAQTFRLYGTFTDASNYRRLFLSSTTAGAFTLGVEGAGTGASGNTLTLGNPVSVTGGTITTSAPALNVSQTWNNAATTFTGILANVTDTASNSASLLMDLQTASTTRFRVWKDGSIQNANGSMALATSFSFNWVTGPEFRLTPAAQIIWATTNATSGGSDLVLVRDAVDTLAQRRSTNAQTFRVYNTYTDASNYERAKIAWESNVLRIGTEKAGTGSARALELQTDGTTRLTIGSAGNCTNVGTFTNQYGATVNDAVSISSVGTLFGGTNSEGVKFQLVCAANADSLRLASTSFIGFNSVGNLNSGSIDTQLRRNAAGQLDVRGDSGLRVRNLANSADADITAKAATFSGNVTVSAVNLVTDTTTGTKIGTATNQKLGFFNATPVVQPTAVADATDAASVITQLNALLSRMRDLGLIAT